MRDPTLYLKDILEAMEAIERFTEGIDVETFCRNDMRSSAVIRKFEIIGEAAKHIPGPIKHQYPRHSLESHGWIPGSAHSLLLWHQE